MSDMGFNANYPLTCSVSGLRTIHPKPDSLFGHHRLFRAGMHNESECFEIVDQDERAVSVLLRRLGYRAPPERLVRKVRCVSRVIKTLEYGVNCRHVSSRQ